MPPVSQAQRRWAYWKLKHGSKKDKKVARKFIGHGVTGLPERVEKSQPFQPLLERLGSTEAPETLTGAAMRHKTTGRVFAIEGFDGGHGAVWSQVKQAENLDESLGAEHVRNTHYEDGFLTSGKRFVGRSEALEIAKKHHQWNGRNRHVAEPDGKPGLMSEAVNKALNIEERYHNPNYHVVLHVRRQDNPQVGVEMGLYHLDHHPEGTWWVDNIVPLGRKADGSSLDYRSQQNQLGTAHMRELFRHLHDVYGVKKLTGTRVTGSREKFDKPEKDTTFNLQRSLTRPPFNGLLYRLRTA